MTKKIHNRPKNKKQANYSVKFARIDTFIGSSNVKSRGRKKLMKKTTLKGIDQILANSILTRIVERVNGLDELNQNIQQIIPKEYSGLYRITNLTDNSLKFDVRDGTTRSGFLLKKTEFLRLIQEKYPEITELEFNINPKFNAN